MKAPNDDLKTSRDCVGVVEDDAAVRRGLCLMLEGLGMEVHAYTSAQEYLDDLHGRKCCACLIVDVRLPGISGIELQRQLIQQGHAPAIVFITGHAEVPMVVEAMQMGAVDFLQKPFKEQQLLDSVQKALALNRRSRETKVKTETATARLACLTSREQQVLESILQGLRTKQIAAEMGIAVKTAEEHRSNLMHKLHASTVADLIAICNAVP
jgi:FixJ family two-component response regulator